MEHGAEIWGWKKRERLERMQERYIRWCLGVDYNTPGNTVLKEVGRKRMCIGLYKKAIQFEVKMTRCKDK